MLSSNHLKRNSIYPLIAAFIVAVLLMLIHTLTGFIPRAVVDLINSGELVPLKEYRNIAILCM